MKKLMLLGAGAVGYVLGAKAGRERYEQISRQAQKIRSNPDVQQKVDEARHVAKDAADTATDKVRSQKGSSAQSGGPAYTSPASGTAGFGRGDENP